MRRSPVLQCESGQPALGSSRPRLRTPANAGHPAQSSSGRDILLAPDERTDLCGKVSREGFQSPQRWEFPTSAVADELENADGTAEVPQAVFPEIDKLHVVRRVGPQE